MDESGGNQFYVFEYLDYLKSVYPPERPTDMLISTQGFTWYAGMRKPIRFYETMTNNYLRHPAYAKYPVVGVNWIKPVQFAGSGTDRVNEIMLEREGYLFCRNAKYSSGEWRKLKFI